jgi:predicted ATPase
MPHYLRAIRLKRDAVASFAEYPFSIPAIRHLERLEFSPGVTFFVGENGSGKSTLVEAIAVKWGFNPEGGGRNFHFATRDSHSGLQTCLVLEKNPNLRGDGYFLRAESFYTLATEIDRLDLSHAYGGKSLHEQSHGEAFLALLNHRIHDAGLYILDEPESALSPQRQLSLLVILDRLVKEGAQLIIATHSPILLAYPGALIYEIDHTGLRRTAYEDTEHYQITRNFLNRREQMLAQLLREDTPPSL